MTPVLSSNVAGSGTSWRLSMVLGLQQGNNGSFRRQRPLLPLVHQCRMRHFRILRSRRGVKIRPLHRLIDSWSQLCTLALTMGRRTDVEDGASQRCFSHLLSEKMTSGGPLSWVQKYRRLQRSVFQLQLWRRARAPRTAH